MTAPKIRLDWIDALKAFAIIGILLNHAVESFGSMPWFSNPSEYWPSFDERMANVFPTDGSFFIRVVQFLGWLGDMGPGIFILLSGLTLTLSALYKPVSTIEFYKTRALRIFPLYITIHVITLIVAIFLFKWEVGFLWSIFSMMGLRFTNSLFWFLNLSWWFVWLILQLYFVFPYLFKLLNKKGTAYFLVTTLVITLLSRTAGILGYTFTADLDTWMMGIFAGTRLFEFAFGMYIGFLIQNKDINLKKLLSDPIKLPLISILVYVTGFASSLTFAGSIFSVILITIGLSGIFYSFYEFILRGNVKIRNLIIWLGKNSFGTFLIHQSFMKFYGTLLTGYTKTIALVIIIIVSFIAGHFFEKMVVFLFKYVQKFYFQMISFFKKKISPISGIVLIAISTILSFLIALGEIQSSRIIVFVFLMQFLYLIFYRVLVNPASTSHFYRYFDLTVVITFVVLIFRGSWMALFGVLIVFSFLLLLFTVKMSHWKAVIIVLTLLSLSIVSTENYLRNYKPLEMNSWGELPALQTDDETIYSLIPNKNTHLRYNNYDYIVKTNSLGFPSPEIGLGLKTADEIRIMITGDAFSMPEGMEYEFSYPALLEKKLIKQYPGKTFKIIDAGVTGYGPNEINAQLKKFIDKINPDIVINQMFINEFLEINLTREERLEEIGLIKAETNKNSIKEKIKTLGNFQLAIQVPFYLKNISGLNEIYDYNKSLLFFYEKDSPFYNDSVLTKMNKFLVDIKELCANNNAELMVLGVPGQVEISETKYISFFPESVNINDTTVFDLNKPLRIIENLCHNNNINYLDSKTILKNYPSQPLYFEKSWHWNTNGHKVISNFLFENLKTHNKLN